MIRDPLAVLGEGRGADDPGRVLVIVAHPDDEVIGAGACLSHLHDAMVVHTTDGSPRDMRDAAEHGFSTRESYAAARHDEVLAALALAGVPSDRLLTLGLVDQEAPLALPWLAEQIASLLRTTPAAAILTHPYEGGHPDHDATAFAVHAARRILAREGATSPPVLEMAFYHARAGAVEIGEFLPARHRPHSTVLLSRTERELKCRMRRCFATQQHVLAPFPMDRERFRRAPRYHFTAPPHAGPLLYELFGWGITGARWCELARDAITELALQEPL